MGAYVRVRAPALAAQLHAALQQGTQLPRPEVADPWGDLERRRARAVLDVASIPPRERQQIEAQLSLEERSVGVRLRTSQQLVQLRADAAAAAAAWEMGGGRYAPAARQLAAWVAEWLAVQHRNRREVLKTWLRSPDYSPGGLSEAEAEGALAVAERDTLLLLLDALWGDFLMVRARACGSSSQGSPGCCSCRAGKQGRAPQLPQAGQLTLARLPARPPAGHGARAARGAGARLLRLHPAGRVQAGERPPVHVPAGRCVRLAVLGLPEGGRAARSWCLRRPSAAMCTHSRLHSPPAHPPDPCRPAAPVC